MTHANGLAVPVTERGAIDAHRSSFNDAVGGVNGYADANGFTNYHSDSNANRYANCHQDAHTDSDTNWHARAVCHANVLGHSAANLD